MIRIAFADCSRKLMDFMGIDYPKLIQQSNKFINGTDNNIKQKC